jgi:hypothetical protein
MPISIAQVKASRLSDDKKEVVIAGKGKYVGELELFVAKECLDDFIQALLRAKTALGLPVDPPHASVAPGLNGGSHGAPKAAPSAPTPNPNEITAELPKNCMVIADPKGRGLVMLVFNHRLDNQRGYALPPDAAKQVAGRLTTSADTVLAGQPPGDPPRTFQA